MDILKQLTLDEEANKMDTSSIFKTNKSLRFDDNTEMSQRDASNLIQQAQDSAEEVDTVAFGLELDDGQIVKVYVNADQAEGFEKAMSDLLGQEDDIEEAIHTLSNEFDIVSVEWPEERTDGTNDNGQPVENDEPEDGNVEQPKETKIQMGFALMNKEGKDKSKDKSDKEESSKDDEIDLETDKEDEAEEDKEQDDDSLDFDTDSDESENKDDEKEDDEKEDEAEEDKDNKKSPVKKDKKKSIKENWAFAGFLGEDDLLVENKQTKIEDIFKTSMQRKILKLILLLDVPVERLLQQKAAFRRGVREAAIYMMHDSKARQAMNKCIFELEAISDISAHIEKEKEFANAHKDDDLKEQTDAHAKQISTLVDMILDILPKLGVPSNVIHSKTMALKQHLRSTARVIIKHVKVRNYLHRLHELVTLKKHKNGELSEAVDFGANQYLDLISSIMSSLGVPDDNLNYKKFALITALREKQKTLNMPAVKARLIALSKVLGANITSEELMMQEETTRKRERAEHIGEWSIAKINDACELSVEHIKIKLDKHNTNELVKAMEHGFQTMVKSGNIHYNFEPINHGIEYVVYNLDEKSNDNGILFNKKAVETLLDLF